MPVPTEVASPRAHLRPTIGIMPSDSDIARLLVGTEPAGTPAVPRHAATIALLREGLDGPEVYLMRRVSSMAFAAGLYVFPGGSVDPRDVDLTDEHWAGPAPQYWADRFGTDEPLARALVAAAVRETFEESGVLLAGPTASTVCDVSDPSWEDDRQALLDRSLSMAGLLERRGLVLRADLLRPWAHWITPEREPRRFDTRFFVAALPAGQVPRDVGGESDMLVWMRPDDALDRSAAGDLAMMPPTIHVTRSLAGAADVDEVLAREQVIVTVLPRIVEVQGALTILMPGDPGYDVP